MGDSQQLTLWWGALRYYMGRQTYAVSDFCDLLIAEWPTLPTGVRSYLMSNIEDEFARDDKTRVGRYPANVGFHALGSDMDRKQWERVRALWRVE